MKHSPNYQWGERALGLPPGKWSLQGLVWVFTPAPEVPVEVRIDHGTERGYRQHRRYGVPQCAECRDAHRLEWHASKRKVAA